MGGILDEIDSRLGLIHPCATESTFGIFFFHSKFALQTPMFWALQSCHRCIIVTPGFESQSLDSLYHFYNFPLRTVRTYVVRKSQCTIPHQIKYFAFLGFCRFPLPHFYRCRQEVLNRHALDPYEGSTSPRSIGIRDPCQNQLVVHRKQKYWIMADNNNILVAICSSCTVFLSPDAFGCAEHVWQWVKDSVVRADARIPNRNTILYYSIGSRWPRRYKRFIISSFGVWHFVCNGSNYLILMVCQKNFPSRLLCYMYTQRKYNVAPGLAITRSKDRFVRVRR